MTTPSTPALDHTDNAFLTAKGYGSRTVKVLTANRGFDLIGGQDEAASIRSFYPMARVASDAVVTFLFPSSEHRDNFVDWIQGYCRWLTSSPSSLLYVSVPVRKFQIYGLPVRGMNYDQRIGDISYRLGVTFTSVIDPTDNLGGVNNANAATVSLPKSQAKTGATFYPTGTQAAGSAGLADDAKTYDTLPPEAAQLLRMVGQGIADLESIL